MNKPDKIDKPNSMMSLADVKPPQKPKPSIKDYERVLDKLREKFEEFANQNSLEDLKRSTVFAKLIIKFEAELRRELIAKLNKKEHDNTFLHDQNVEYYELMKTTYNAVGRLAKDHVKNKDNRKKSGIAMKKKYHYMTEVAVDICRAYSERYPRALNTTVCAKGVTAEIQKRLINHFYNNKEELKKANIIDTPSDKTIRKHVELAYKRLGFPRFSDSKNQIGKA